MPAPQITLTANMTDLMGAIVPGSQLSIQLCGFGSQVPRVAGTGVLAKTAPLAILADATGVISQLLFGNDVITPAGTFYTVAVADDNGNVVQLNAYQFLGVGTFDLSSAAPFDPPPLSALSVNPVLLFPPGAAVQTINGPITINGNLIVNGTINGGGSIYTLAFSPTPIFDGTLGSSFKLRLTGNVTSSTIANMAGKLLVPIRISQDAIGGRTFLWPANVRDGGQINPGPNSHSLQLFAVDTDGSLDAAGPMMYAGS